jgi:hypothetical protein
MDDSQNRIKQRKRRWIHHPDQVRKEKIMTGTLKIEAVTKLGKI